MMRHTAETMRRFVRRFATLAASALLAAGTMIPAVVAPVAVLAAPPNNVTLSVESARTEPLAFGGAGRHRGRTRSPPTSG